MYPAAGATRFTVPFACVATVAAVWQLSHVIAPPLARVVVWMCRWWPPVFSGAAVSRWHSLHVFTAPIVVPQL